VAGYCRAAGYGIGGFPWGAKALVACDYYSAGINTANRVKGAVYVAYGIGKNLRDVVFHGVVGIVKDYAFRERIGIGKAVKLCRVLELVKGSHFEEASDETEVRCSGA
jgi:hypothetical protein